MAIAIAVTFGLSVPLTPNNSADAAGSGFEVRNWTDPSGKQHRIRWNPCQAGVTYAVNPRQAGKTSAARASAVADVKAAIHRVSQRTGVPFSYSGRTSEIPNNGSGSWSSRQKSAELVIAWANQSRAKYHSDLLTNNGSGYGSGVGGWLMGAWTDSNGKWQAAIVRGFVVLNAGHNSRYRAGWGKGVTRGALLLHEIGHAVGLGHVGTTREIMYPTMLSRASSRYRDGDRSGLKRVGRPLGCVPGNSPSWPQI